MLLNRTSVPVAVVAAAALLVTAPAAKARVTKIVKDVTVSPAFNGATFGPAGIQYETIAGRVFGELDPHDHINKIITDLELAPRNAHGKVEYMATFFLVKPIDKDMSKSSHLMWQDVPNRGGRITIGLERNDGDIGLSSGWQGDNSGDTAQVGAPLNTNDYAVVPVAKNRDGSSITGVVMGRILNASGPNSSAIIEHSNPLAYVPISLDTRQSTLESHDHETQEGVVSGRRVFAPSEWAWARCGPGNPFPGTPDPHQICMKDGFAPNKVHQVVFKAKDPPILAVGTAAFRDAASFFKFETHDDFGNPNPVAGQIKWVITRGSSQSGTFIRQLIHFGFTQDEAKRTVYDGAWPIVAARRIGLNFRFAKPDLVMKLYESGSEGPVWWERWEDKVRGLPPRGILDRCRRSHSCPKIVEHFGAAEAWGQKLTTGWVGTDAAQDIPLPDNVRRYYFGGSPHGGGSGGFNVNAGSLPSCSGTNYGTGTFPTNPMPQRETVNALRFHFRNWVMKGIVPPPSVYPKLDPDGDDHRGKKEKHSEPLLVPVTRKDIGFPALPQVLASANPNAPDGEDFIMAFVQYDWGDDLNYTENAGFHDFEPPLIRRVIKQVVPRTDADGNELGGVPVVLMRAPLGTYLGWNVTSGGFHKGQVCNYQGGWIPFARTKAERLAKGDPRLSLEERYGTHQGYVNVVSAAVADIEAQGYLLKADGDALIAAAQASNVLNP